MLRKVSAMVSFLSFSNKNTQTSISTQKQQLLFLVTPRRNFVTWKISSNDVVTVEYPHETFWEAKNKFENRDNFIFVVS